MRPPSKSALSRKRSACTGPRGRSGKRWPAWNASSSSSRPRCPASRKARNSLAEISERRRGRDAMAREVRHQPEIEGQLLGGQALKEREHIAALRRGNEVVGVLD